MASAKPVTDTTIPGTKVPDVTQVNEDPAAKAFMSKVAITTAILATLASLASMFSGSHLNQAMLEQIKSSNQWNYFQAKGIKLAVVESRIETMKQMSPATPADREDAERVQRYTKEQGEISAEAKRAETSSEDHRKRHTTLGRSSTAFQVAIALAAVALLSKRKPLWLGSMLLGGIGTVFFVLGMI